MKSADILSSTEIERKFLLVILPAAIDGCSRVRVRQGYLALDPDGTEVRIRKVGEERWQTIKRGEGLVRTEVQIALHPTQFRALWPLTAGRRIEKIRYNMVVGEHIIEIDVYEGTLKGLLTAEVEFTSVEASHAFQPLPWLGQEITNDYRYMNKYLAQNGLPSD